MPDTKVLFCTDGIFPHSVGGIQRHSQLLIEALAKRGNVEITVVHPHSAHALFSAYPEIKEIHIDPMTGRRNYLLDIYHYTKRVAEIAHQHPDHVLYAQGVTIWHDIKSLGDRVIFNPHGLEPFQPLTFRDKIVGFPYHLIYGHLFKHAAKVVALGGKLTQILGRAVPHADRKVVVLPNATLLPEEAAVPERFRQQKKAFKCLFLGRFASNKGITHLLETARSLHQQDQTMEVQFTLAGKGPLYQDLLKEGEKLLNVDMPGFVADEDLPGLFQTHDVFILPTLMEGMPTVVLEAMAYGMPIIVTDVGATRELVDEQNGFIIEKRSAEAIKNAIQQFAQLNLSQQQKMSMASRERVAKQFVWDIVARQHEEVFIALNQQLLHPSRPASYQTSPLS
ncbi:MAG: glycosyltransferase family 4 protein [Bacteroidota bacterium]